MFLNSYPGRADSRGRRAGVADRHFRRHVSAGYSLDNFSLMALTIATGFVVDDAIVVMENTTRHIEAGMTRMQAALLGAREVGFTVLSMSLSLVAVFTAVPVRRRHPRAPVQRIRHDPVGGDPDLAGGVAHHHADDVLAACCGREVKRVPSRFARGFERGFESHARRITSARSTGRCEHRRVMVSIARRDHRIERLPVRRDSQGILPAAGYRPAARRHARRRGELRFR